VVGGFKPDFLVMVPWAPFHAADWAKNAPGPGRRRIQSPRSSLIAHELSENPSRPPKTLQPMALPPLHPQWNPSQWIKISDGIPAPGDGWEVPWPFFVNWYGEGEIGRQGFSPDVDLFSIQPGRKWLPAHGPIGEMRPRPPLPHPGGGNCVPGFQQGPSAGAGAGPEGIRAGASASASAARSAMIFPGPPTCWRCLKRRQNVQPGLPDLLPGLS